MDLLRSLLWRKFWGSATGRVEHINKPHGQVTGVHLLSRRCSTTLNIIPREMVREFGHRISPVFLQAVFVESGMRLYSPPGVPFKSAPPLAALRNRQGTGRLHPITLRKSIAEGLEPEARILSHLACH